MRKSFFARLTGRGYDEEELEIKTPDQKEQQISLDDEEDFGSQLAIDVYQTPENIIVEAHVAGVKPDELDVTITREMVTIKGERSKVGRVEEDQYFAQELFWGRFSRTVLLPQEVEAEQAEAKMSDGTLRIMLPRINKDKIHKLRIKN